MRGGIYVSSAKASAAVETKGGIQIGSLGCDFFVAKFENMEDREFVLQDGPWTILGHYLSMREWVPHFIPSKAKIDKATTWGNFARICVEIDLAKTLKGHFKLRGDSFDIAYEGIQLVCFRCGRYSHRQDECSAAAQAPISP
ncbi:hypothetical protein CRG98_036317 [Punica granatum]|uniref:CCHC-type domain-containing protein n=1 Tax=Punica granatum TaxID=22663 RepID=A0A2I0IHU5_PUNGR|nr:hypothetical protein CRG98_036317 [Punica granatum]